ncbi:T9SS type B sorting domain-containing protein [Flavobacterium zepuense]|uniref:T9SS type B sorting domain-containing protein n=1 Tax=Flavobacterium zepuense TaxID=2593302 RepID=A0A552V9P9_9FLAO|nr:T9SS type B sorting domain-containing protein [Flavobacterium zepuense]TRW27169.1 T9SS type B sorting domain-containing protein [Flavobacterium zepuense]
MKTIIILLLFTSYTQAQEHNIWYFGYHAGLDFNGGAPLALTDGQINTIEGTASISDNNGDLLFYTDGVTIWNKDHQIMENGNDLMGHESSTQSAIIIPKPGSQQQYYVFTVPAGGTSGFRYSTIDLGINSGLGAVINKNNLLQAPAAECINTTWHNNGEDIWVVAHSYNFNLFYTYLVTTGGVSSSPVISSSVLIPDAVGMGSVKISPDGSKIAFTRNAIPNGTQVFDFNNATGVISNPIQLTATGGYDYGVEFSASGNVLYTTSGPHLNQYDLLANDIAASGIVIIIGVGFGSIQRGPDNKIYAARIDQNYVSVINNPETIGVGCNFQAEGVSLGGNDFLRLSTFGLPNTVLSPVFKIKLDNQTLCIGEVATFSINPSTTQFESVLWEFGDGNTSAEVSPVHTYQAAGTYTVKLTAHRQGITKVTQTSITVSPIPPITQPANMALCDENHNGTALFNLIAQNAPILGTQDPNEYIITYHTTLEYAESGTDSLDGNFANTSNPQTIYVRMEDKHSGCYATTSFDLIVAPEPVIAMPDNYTFCQGSTAVLTAPEGFETYLWSTGDTARIINVNVPGNYILTVTENNNGSLCESSKAITVYVSDAPIITQIHSSDWTDNHNTISISVSGSGNYEYSLNGITYQDSPEFTGLESGIYNVYARNKNGCGLDIDEIMLLMYPKFFTPNGDGINDTWRIKHSWNEPGLSVTILDRYGKYITTFAGNSTGWDGTLMVVRFLLQIIGLLLKGTTDASIKATFLWSDKYYYSISNY